MAKITLGGSECHTCGTLPATGAPAPGFTLVKTDLSPLSLEDLKGKKVVLNIFPSLDTEVCARSVRRFNEEAARLKDTAVVCVSMDLPFAMSRFCTLEGIAGVTFASAFRSPLFGQNYGVMMTDGPLAGLLARAVMIIDRNRRMEYVQLVDEITHEPDYEAALSVLK